MSQFATFVKKCCILPTYIRTMRFQQYRVVCNLETLNCLRYIIHHRWVYACSFSFYKHHYITAINLNCQKTANVMHLWLEGKLTQIMQDMKYAYLSEGLGCHRTFLKSSSQMACQVWSLKSWFWMLCYTVLTWRETQICLKGSWYCKLMDADWKLKHV